MPTEYQILSEADQRWQQDLALQIAQETRLPVPRVMMLEWNQIDGKTIHTRNNREVELQPLTAAAITRLPCRGRFVFSASPFPPIIPDEYLDGARLWAKRENRRKRRGGFFGRS